MLIEVFMSFTLGIAFGADTLIIEKFNFITYIGLIFIGWFKYIIIYYIGKFRKYKYSFKRNKWHIQLAFILLLCITLLYVYINEQLGQEHLNYLFSYFLVGVIIVINIFQYVIFDKVEVLFEEKLEYNNLMQYFKYRETYYNQLELHQEEIRMIRHNLKNQLIAIKGNVEGKEVNNELKSIIDEIARQENICYTRNVGLNTILNIKHKEMVEKNIDSNFEIKIPEKINLSGRDIGNLIGNILDNAIEACEKCEKNKFINLILYYYNHTVVISCVNKVEEENKELKTHKNNPQEHGLGLKSIEKIVQKYNGVMKTTFCNKIFELEINLWNI
jgi:sensor histidine kinase YesM